MVRRSRRQVESARATFAKLELAIGLVESERLLSLDDGALRAIGFSRQKASYVRGVAREIVAKSLDLTGLQFVDDEAARKILVQVRGIGAWTADTYLLFSLRRHDVWPSGDLALAKAIQESRGLATVPGSDEVDRMVELWRPWRAVAARILWHYYLSKRHRTASTPPDPEPRG